MPITKNKNPNLIIAAIGGYDYTSASSDLIFTSGSNVNAVRCVDISLLEDIALEGNQTFSVTLSTSDPDVMLGNDIITITITDNDGWYPLAYIAVLDS